MVKEIKGIEEQRNEKNANVVCIYLCSPEHEDKDSSKLSGIGKKNSREISHKSKR